MNHLPHEAAPIHKRRVRLPGILVGASKTGLYLPRVTPHTTALDVIVFAAGMLAGAAVVFMLLMATTGGYQ